MAVVARDKYVAEDAANAVLIEYERLPIVGNMEDALKPGSPIVHDGWENNEMFSMTLPAAPLPRARQPMTRKSIN